MNKPLITVYDKVHADLAARSIRVLSAYLNNRMNVRKLLFKRGYIVRNYLNKR